MKAIYRLALLTCAAVVLTLPSCESDGNLNVLGYTTRPNYDCSIHTIHVPIFQNHTFAKGIEFDLTRAVVRAIELQTPYKVVGEDKDADAELSGTIISFAKNTLNVNPLNEIREQETVLTVEVTWRNLRTGEFLSDPARRPQIGTEATPLVLPGAAPVTDVPGVLTPGFISAPTNPGGPVATIAQPAPAVGPDGKPILLGPDGKPIPTLAPPAAKVIITSTGNFIPELGQSLTTAQKQNVDRLAVQIVSMMEKPWSSRCSP
jgi:Lipopolysaccharide-assembly